MKTFLLALLLPAWAALAHSADFTPEQRQSLLDYTRNCLISRLEIKQSSQLDTSFPQRQRACFVTFFHKHQVIACFGSFTPRRPVLHEEISENIRLALKNDTRAFLMTRELARSVEIQLTFPQPPQRISSWRIINPLHEGLLVEASDGRGVAIVPGEARTAQYAWRSALQRLGLNEQTPGIRLYRFRAEKISTFRK